MKKTVILLFSGGQDSTTCLLWALTKWAPEEILCLGFDYGQKHRMEQEQARQIAHTLGVDFTIRSFSGLTGNSALLDTRQDVSAAHAQAPELPATFTAGRNALFLTVAGALAFEYGAAYIVTGVCETDYSGYPDCRAEFITSQQRTLQLALGMEHLHICAPLMYLTKAETWKMAKDLSAQVADVCQLASSDLPFEIVRTHTLTDYNGDTTLNDWGLGREDNPASKLRAAGYREAKAQGWV